MMASNDKDGQWQGRAIARTDTEQNNKSEGQSRHSGHVSHHTDRMRTERKGE